MDPITTSISSVFGLLATFFQEQRGRSQAQTQTTIQDYIEWLRRNNHAEVVTMLGSNHQLSQAIQHLLVAGHDELLERFDRLESMLTLIMGTTAEWGELVRSINPHAGLSDQAIEILRWFDASGRAKAIMYHNRGDHFLQAMGGSGDNFRPDEPRFFEADLNTLSSFGLLIEELGSQGYFSYTITRQAVSLAQSFGASGEDESVTSV